MEKRIAELEKGQDDNDIALSKVQNDVSTNSKRITDGDTVANSSLLLIQALTDRLDVTDKRAKRAKTKVTALKDEVVTVSDSVYATGNMAGKLMDRVTKFEEDDRKKTLLLVGFPENPREDLRQVCDCLFQDLTLTYGNERVDSIYRLGRFDPDKDRPRTIVLKLAH